MNTIVFLDMDGVLSDFFAGALRIYDTSFEDVVKRYKGVLPLEYNVGRWLTDVHYGRIKIGEKELTDKINEHDDFWYKLERYTWAAMLVELIESYVKDNLFICSAPWRHNCHSQKIKWIDIHFPHLRRRTILTDHKEFMARSNHILIDDCDANIEKFRAHEGSGITFPQPWNKNHSMSGSGYDRISHVRQELLMMMDELNR